MSYRVYLGKSSKSFIDKIRNIKSHLELKEKLIQLKMIDSEYFSANENVSSYLLIDENILTLNDKYSLKDENKEYVFLDFFFNKIFLEKKQDKFFINRNRKTTSFRSWI